jgi:5-methylcytosine-specific restriction protein A
MTERRRNPDAGWIDTKTLERGTNGRALCRRCRIEVPKGRRSFCGNVCVHEWKLRSDPSYLRECVFARDKGICAACGVDTERWRRQRSRRTGQKRLDFLQQIGVPPHRKSLWDADHVVPVAFGGGSCGLDNIQTLCYPCHLRKTNTQKVRRPVQTPQANQADDAG